MQIVYEPAVGVVVDESPVALEGGRTEHNLLLAVGREATEYL